MASPISTGISIGMGILGLRFLWKSQHRLDRRGYLVLASLILIGVIFVIIGFPPRPGLVAVILFDSGVILIGALLLFPDIVYYSLRFYDRRRAHRSEA
jgi:hypothetical protein